MLWALPYCLWRLGLYDHDSWVFGLIMAAFYLKAGIVGLVFHDETKMTNCRAMTVIWCCFNCLIVGIVSLFIIQINILILIICVSGMSFALILMFNLCRTLFCLKIKREGQ